MRGRAAAGGREQPAGVVLEVVPEVVLTVVVPKEALVTDTPRADNDKLSAHKLGTHRRLVLSDGLAPRRCRPAAAEMPSTR